MIDSLSRPIRRALALAILVAIPLLLWLVVVSPLSGMVAERRAAIATQLDRMERLNEVIARIPALKAQDQALADRLKTQGDVWVESSDAVVSAKMESIVRGLVEQNGGSLSSSSPLATTEAQEFRIVRLRFTISGPLDTVVKTLEGVARAKPALFVDGFKIEIPANATPPDKPPELNLDIEVQAYLQQAST